MPRPVERRLACEAHRNRHPPPSKRVTASNLRANRALYVGLVIAALTGDCRIVWPFVPTSVGLASEARGLDILGFRETAPEERNLYS